MKLDPTSIMFGREMLNFQRAPVSKQTWQELSPIFMPEPPEGLEIRFIRKLGGIGDVMRLALVARVYKETYPDVKIRMSIPGKIGCFQGRGGMFAAELFRGMNCFEELTLFENLKEGSYDPDTTVNFDNWMIVDLEHRLLWSIGHVPDRTELMMHFVGLHPPLEKMKPTLHLSTFDEEWALERIRKIGSERKEVIAVSLYSAGLHRTYSMMRCVGCFLRKKGYKVILLEDEETDFLKLAALVKKSNFLITGDTSWVHIANAFDIPSLVVFSTSIPSTVIRANPLAVPLHGGCSISHFPCALRPTCQPVEMWDKMGEMPCMRRLTPKQICEYSMTCLEALV